MLIDVIRGQHAALRAAVEALASLSAPADARAARAVAEVGRAFAAGVPVWAGAHVAAIRTLAGDDPNAVGVRVATLSPAELTRITTAIVELYTLACREYWTA